MMEVQCGQKGIIQRNSNHFVITERFESEINDALFSLLLLHYNYISDENVNVIDLI